MPPAVRVAQRGRITARRAAMLSHAGGLVVAGVFATFAPGRHLHGVA